MTFKSKLLGEVKPSEEWVEVVLPLPISKRFTYRLPEGLRERAAVGARAIVPFGSQKSEAYICGVQDTAPLGHRIKELLAIPESEPIFPPELFRFLEQAADYYFHPLGEVLRAAAPSLVRSSLAHINSAQTTSARTRTVGLQKRWIVRPNDALQVCQPLASNEGNNGEENNGEGNNNQGSPGVQRASKLSSAQKRALEFLGSRNRIVSLAELMEETRCSRDSIRRLSSRGLLSLEQQEILDEPFFSHAFVATKNGEKPTGVHHLNAEQRAAVGSIGKAIDRSESESFLLFGVTGSGKTEVYLAAAQTAQTQGKGVLILLPEIALTPQFVSRVRHRFGDQIVVLHSQLSARARYAAWRRLRTGEVQIAVGVRSALFAPVQNLGLIIVDEEHDNSFKQEEGFRYHARDMALLRSKLAKAVCVLGSATPSLESMWLAMQGKHRLLKLNQRATHKPLPTVTVVDLRQHPRGPTGHTLVSGLLIRELQSCLERGEQSIVFLNRRGFSTTLRCEGCGEIAYCSRCSVPLTEHHKAAELRCHYCGIRKSVHFECTSCGASTWRRLGLGTEGVQEALAESLPQARLLRLDRDTAGRGVEAIVDAFDKHHADILIGTQMVAKGHDFANVTLVGVILAEQSMAFPDFRAAERTFQLLSQVAGRSGRSRPGTVIFQTYSATHPVLTAAKHHNYAEFARQELEVRRKFGYPPFGRLVALRVDATEEATALGTIETIASKICTHSLVQQGKVTVLGPAPAPIAKVRNRFRYRLFLRSSDRNALRHLTRELITLLPDKTQSARASIDVDPVSML